MNMESEQEHEKIKERGLMAGSQSFVPNRPVYIRASACVGGTKEGAGLLGGSIDLIGEDDLFGCKTWEEAESTLQKEAVALVLGKAKMKAEDIRYLFAGDLLGQSMASSFGVSSFGIPHLGVYGACSTCGETLGLGTMAISGGAAEDVICVTSSHFASAEKEFRYPLSYGNQRPPSATWTVTGSAAFILTSKVNKENRAEITGVTSGKIVDYGIKDSLNMGVCMAPAASELIAANLRDFDRKPEDYDKIITGDLGLVGQRALIDLLREKNIDIESRHLDCGIEIYDCSTQDVGSGGSGCGCSAVTLSAYILKMLEKGDWKRVLFVPTGALLSKTSFNEGMTVPGIAHGVVIESAAGVFTESQ